MDEADAHRTTAGGSRAGAMLDDSTGGHSSRVRAPVSAGALARVMGSYPTRVEYTPTSVCSVAGLLSEHATGRPPPHPL